MIPEILVASLEGEVRYLMENLVDAGFHLFIGVDQPDLRRSAIVVAGNVGFQRVPGTLGAALILSDQSVYFSKHLSRDDNAKPADSIAPLM
jgi:hypothetical protein